MLMRTLSAALALATQAPGERAAPTGDDTQQVVELRQYRIVPGKRDMFIDLFESRFIESQEELGMRLAGQFKDQDDPDRFTWITAFSSMEARGRQLNAFYFGPVWQANRAAANPLLDDNDNVLLLRPAWHGSAFGPPAGVRPPPGATAPAKGLVIVTIEYLWKDPGEGYSAYFRDRLAPAYRAAGLPLLGAYVIEPEANNFPRLHVRQNERIFLWVTRASDRTAYAAAMREVHATREWRSSLGPAVRGYLERPPQTLFLSPTSRSLMR